MTSCGGLGRERSTCEGKPMGENSGERHGLRRERERKGDVSSMWAEWPTEPNWIWSWNWTEFDSKSGFIPTLGSDFCWVGASFGLKIAF